MFTPKDIELIGMIQGFIQGQGSGKTDFMYDILSYIQSYERED